jgi:hypothetical protein
MADTSNDGMPQWARILLDQNMSLVKQLNEYEQRMEVRVQAIEGKRPPPNNTTTHATAIETPLPESPRSEPIRRPRPRLPDPPTFKGSRGDWPVWRMAIENKLLVDSEAIGDDRACLLYVYSRLEGNASKNTVAFMQHRRQDGSPHDLILYLDNIYGDPNLKKRATQRLREMKQGTKQSFAKFLPKFEKEFADSGAMTWPEDAKISILTGSLNLTMRTALAYRDAPGTFADLILLLRRIDTDFDLLATEVKRQTSGDEGWPNRSRSPAADQMDWTPTTKANRTRSSEEGRSRRAKWVEKDEMDRRREEGLCFRCGRENCQVSTCPLLPAIKPDAKVRTVKAISGKGRKGTKPSARAKRSRAATPSESELEPSEDDTDLESDSGKD